MPNAVPHHYIPDNLYDPLRADADRIGPSMGKADFKAVANLRMVPEE